MSSNQARDVGDLLHRYSVDGLLLEPPHPMTDWSHRPLDEIYAAVNAAAARGRSTTSRTSGVDGIRR
ncbi:hypothetical protein GA0070624_1460 [Micromonospora rhizosphaerae]|uniref:Uncharacterized protein n=1 Tax=Micromonospora rhizosphaerae TaxID=568872 RepID=A0A1C6RLY8_9ACTN|nr:hypothetical protein [Micromonospora rhizosphaerae]SCL18139.1 hypothetical protein GA0070624_1460 [Micromonospora rhizosphaerae]